MLQWITDHWPAITAWLGTTGVAIWAWVSAHHGQLRKIFRAIRQQLHLRSEFRVTTEQLAIARTEAAQERARAEQLAADNDKLTKLLQPPERRPEIQELLLITAAREDRVHWGELVTLRGEHVVTSRFHIQELIDAGLFEMTEDQFKSCILTKAGNAYLVQYGLVPPHESRAERRTRKLAEYKARQADAKPKNG